MILHIATSNTFTRPFFAFVKQNLGLENHVVLSRSRHNEWPEDLNARFYNGMWFGWLASFIYLSWKAEKIILHGLNDPRVVILLFFQPWLLKKCYWVVWGEDLYAYQAEKKDWKWQIKEIFRRSVIKHIGHLVTSVQGDVELARKWYAAEGRHHECIVYTSNLYQDRPENNRLDGTLNIQLGNSADPSNNHVEILERLRIFQDQDIVIHAPLSYGGDHGYIDHVIDVGTRIFGRKFVAYTKFMPIGEYLDFLSEIDIGIFDHRRQQSMGNIITLLGFGRKIYMRNSVSTWKLFEKLEIKVYDNAQITLSRCDVDVARRNRQIVRNYFSEANLTDQLEKLFCFSSDGGMGRSK